MFGSKKKLQDTKTISVGEAANQETISKAHQLAKVAYDSKLAVDRNKWALVTIALALLSGVLGFQVVALSKAAADNLQVVYVKLQPDGTWDVDYYDANRPTEFFKKTVDALLAQYTQYRYSKMPKSITEDYAVASLFMAPEIYKRFTDAQGFNAAGVAAEYEQCANCEPVDVQVRDVVHVDWDSVQFDGIESKVFRSNIYYDEIPVSNNGDVLTNNTKKRILQVHWRVKSRLEIEGVARSNKRILRANPIGLEILKQNVIEG